MTFSMTVAARRAKQLIADLVALHTSASTPTRPRYLPCARDVIELFPAHYEDRACVSRCSAMRSSRSRSRSAHRPENPGPEIRQGLRHSHYVTPRPTLNSDQGHQGRAQGRLQQLYTGGPYSRPSVSTAPHLTTSNAESDRLCAGIENYSRWLTGAAGTSRRTCSNRPTTLLVSRRSHVTVPQIGARYKGGFGGRRPWRVWLPRALLLSTTGRCGSRNGTRCARRPCIVRFAEADSSTWCGTAVISQRTSVVGSLSPTRR